MEKNKGSCNHLPKFWFMILCFILFLSVIGIGLNQYYRYRLIPYEFERSCNTGFIGIDFKSTIDDHPYKVLEGVYDIDNLNDFRLVQKTNYFSQIVAKELNLKNIDGLNCNFKVKGAIPLDILNNILKIN